MDAYVRRSSMHHLSAIQFRDERIDLQSQAYYTEQGLALQGAVVPRLRMTLLGHWGALQPGGREKGYALDMDGGWRVLQGSWQAQLRQRLLLLGHVRYRSLESDPSSWLQGKRFSRAQMRLEDRASSVWMRYDPGVNRYLELGCFTGYGKGRLQRGRLES